MLKEKVRNKLRSKLGTTKEIKHMVFGPRDLVKKLPSLIGKAPDNNTIVVVETDGSYIESIKFVDISEDYANDAIEIVKSMHVVDKQLIFCIYTTKPNSFKGLADDLMTDFSNGNGWVRDVLYINKNRWGSYLCIDKSCCPKAGNKID